MIFINPSDRPLGLSRGEVLGTFEPVEPNTPFTYFTKSASSQPKPILDPRPHDSHPHPHPPTYHVEADPCPQPTLKQPPPTTAESQYADSTPLPKKPQVVTHDYAEKAKFPPNEMEEIMMEHGLSDGESSDEKATKPDELLSEGDLEWDINPKLKLKYRIQMLKMLRKRKHVFSGPTGRLGCLKGYEMTIDADYKKIKSSSAYRASPRNRKAIRKAVEELLEKKVIQKSTSPVASPVVVVWHKNKARFCVDLRAVNSETEPDRYALPRQDSIFMSFDGAFFFTTLDATKSYHQVRLAKKSQHLTAFITEEFGLMEFLRVPFGLKNAPAFFQRCIDEVIAKYGWTFVLAYIDDIVIFFKTYEEHLSHVTQVLKAFEEIELTMTKTKCHFEYTNIKLLGHKVSRFDLSTQKEKVEAIMALEFPKTVREAMTMLRKFGYNREFMKLFSIIAEPLISKLALISIEKNSFNKFNKLFDFKTRSHAIFNHDFE